MTIMALFSLSLGLSAWNVLLLVAGWIVVVLWIKERWTLKPTRHGKPLRKTPNTLPILGNGIIFLQPRQRLFEWFASCERRFGYETLHASVPTLPPGVIISSPENLDYVFRNEGSIFIKGDFFKHRSQDLMGHGIINVDGQLWRLQRKAGKRFLSTQTLKIMMSEEMPGYLDAAAGSLSGRSKTGGAVDLQGVLLEMTTQLTGRMAYNMEMHADDDFTLAFEHASGVTAERVQNPLWYIKEFITGNVHFRRSIAIIKAHGRRIVASAVADRAAAHGTGGLSDTSGILIQSLLDSIGDQDLVADAALNYLSASRDTITQALTWAFYLLIQNPHVMAKLRDDIQDLQDSTTTSAEPIQVVVADSDSDSDSDADIGLFTPTRLPYALAIFYETLRLRPPIPFELKQVQEPTTLPDGTFLPAGSLVIWCLWALGLSRTTWGPDADTFRPERWLTTTRNPSTGTITPTTTTTITQRPPGEYPVFHGGPRACLGKKMAESIFVQTLARFVSEFDFSPAYAGERVSVSSLTLPMEGGLPVYVQSRRAKVVAES